MAQTFGAATGDDISIATHLNNNSATQIFFGWFYPTTLTAGRAYWGATASSNLKVHTTTSELALAIDRTTDSLWTTTGAAIVVNEWVFIAIAKSSNAGAANIRCWIGHGTAVPQEVTIAETTVGSGAEVASSVASIGNATSATTVAFQGDIGQCLDLRTSTSGVPGTMLVVETTGTITQAEADYFLTTAVIPFWRGEPLPGISRGGNYACYLFDLEAITPQMDIQQNGTVQRIGPELLTVNGATPSQNRQPMGIMTDWPVKLQRVPGR